MLKVSTSILILFVSCNCSFAQQNNDSTIIDIDKKKKIALLGNVGYSSGRILYNDNKGDQQSKWRNSMQLNSSISYGDKWFIRSTFNKHFTKDLPVWIADFSYSVEHFNWRPGTFSYGYENYINNRYKDDWNTLKNNFMLGNYYLSYNLKIPDKFLTFIRIDSTSNFSVKISSNYSLRYLNNLSETEGSLDDGKLLFKIGLRYVIFKNIYIESAIILYPEKHKKVAWDPDFTYGFGYFDWHPFTIGLSYGNWVVNRFPLNNKEINNYGFLDGEFKLNFNYRLDFRSKNQSYNSLINR